MKKSEGFKIISLDISNIRKIKAFNMVLNGDNLHVAGNVSEGKTTAISALWEILTKSQDSVSHGERKGVIKIKLAGGGKTLFAERVNTAKTSTLRIFNENGDKLSAKEFNQMISGLAVNPHKIKEMSPQEQVHTLLRSAKVSVDMQKLDEDINQKELERLDAHRDVERSRPTGDKPPKVERINVSELIDELEKFETVNRDNQKHRDSLSSLTSEGTKIESDIAELEVRLKELSEKKKEISGRIKKGEDFVSKLKDEDTQGIKAKIADAESINNQAIAYESWVKANKTHEQNEKEHQKLDDDVKKLKAQKKEALEDAEWPIEGLSIMDGQIYYDQSLLENLGESEQMLVCAALAMNDILAHDIRVVRMDGVESMSEEHLEKLVSMFNGHGIQVLSTRVSRGDISEKEIEIIDGQYGKDE
jgi:hypothetical protein